MGSDRTLWLRKVIAGPNQRAAVGIGAPVLLALALALKAWKAPSQLALVVCGIFVLWSVVFWNVRRSAERPGLKTIACFLAGFVLMVGVVLGSTCLLDRSGWLWYRLAGYNTTFASESSDWEDRSLDQCLHHHPSFVKDPQDGTALVLPSGEYDFDETVVIPRGGKVRIKPGVVIRFSAGCSLISYSPVIARGTAERPIRFQAQSPWRKWGVVAVIRSDKSIFEHAHFEDCRFTTLDAVEVPGGLSLIDADGEIAYCRFQRMFGKDAVYVRQGHVEIHNNVFEDIFKDGLDLDGGSGLVHANRFVDCGDEGIDLSESPDVDVSANEILDTRGGRIAADRGLAAIRSRNTLGFSPRKG
ncbi:MAG: right-handed parallel beta-helix repeat-containing protein [Pirellulales bacterium]|nr:right-handed parallel beta-helix repeat-containing protein [Pirellulales bacterium]